MTAATMTPDARKVIANLRDHGPATISDMGSLFSRAVIEASPQTAAERKARLRAHLALSDLEQAGRIVRVRTRRAVWFMVPDDAADLITEAQQSIGFDRAPA